MKLAVDIIKQQIKNGVSFDFIRGDGYYGNDTNLAGAINRMGYIYMLDIHSDQKIFTQQPDLILPERKGSQGPFPKKLKVTTQDISVTEYMKNLEDCNWKKIVVRNTAKGKLTGEYHFASVFIWNGFVPQPPLTKPRIYLKSI